MGAASAGIALAVTARERLSEIFTAAPAFFAAVGSERGVVAGRNLEAVVGVSDLAACPGATFSGVKPVPLALGVRGVAKGELYLKF